jgi:hypothetical protein
MLLKSKAGNWIEKNEQQGAQIDLLIDRDDSVNYSMILQKLSQQKKAANPKQILQLFKFYQIYKSLFL